MPTVTKQYRTLTIQVEFELDSSQANAGWEVTYIEEPPWTLYDAGLTQEDIDRECDPEEV